ncbi:MAG TPA: DUF488 family protein [Candidatus Agrococcus pullicola]|uniref:DUF488 family protein n=1 Tax=Candidatus Agrococcus pullicola TaxID=2838429 RepID=A0A9D1YVF8_9MICO|nr:DUF488 family protein [Candidatus Agrococcus pullicola]
MTEFRHKRIYAAPEEADGFRVLVDRLWPRGKSEAAAEIDLWAKDIAPTNELRKRFHSDDDYAGFHTDYLRELDGNDAAPDVFEALREHDVVTLLTAAKHPERSHVQVLLDRLRAL